MTIGDRVANTFIGASLGLLVGGAVVATSGAAGCVFAGSASANIAFLGASGAQTFSIGALAVDTWAIVIAPFFGIEMDPIEYSS